MLTVETSGKKINKVLPRIRDRTGLDGLLHSLLIDLSIEYIYSLVPDVAVLPQCDFTMSRAKVNANTT